MTFKNPKVHEGMACIGFFLIILLTPTMVINCMGIFISMSLEGFMQPWEWSSISRGILVLWFTVCSVATLLSIKATYKKHMIFRR